MKKKQKNTPDKIAINPNQAAQASDGIFGLPFSFEESAVIFLPVPWEATTSYGGGTVHGPAAILQASVQLDLFDLDVKNPYEAGMHCLPISKKIQTLNATAKKTAQPIKNAGGIHNKPSLKAKLKIVNAASAKLNDWVRAETKRIFRAGKIPGLIGGDHSIPFGAFQSAAEQIGDFGILHFDAHSDTRDSYMGFSHSHASIMRNAATQIPAISKFVQVGIRDFCEEELDFIKSQGPRFEVHFDSDIQALKFHGATFHSIAERIIEGLPEKVWVSFDIDGLDSKYCPHTGTPVPGGLDYPEAIHILRLLAKSGRKIIGFDVVEVAPPVNSAGRPIKPVQAIDEWDANVGMRLLYKLAALALASQGRM